LTVPGAFVLNRPIDRLSTVSDVAVFPVADDDTDFSYLIRYAIRKAGIRASVRFVQDGQAAIDYLEGNGEYARRDVFPLPHFAIIDIRMPCKTGLQVLEWIRTSVMFRALPVMMISLDDIPDDRKRAKELAAEAYVIKRSSNQEMADALKVFHEAHWPRAAKMYAPQGFAGQKGL
jgi:CheY-like chemotaxis protein